MFCQAELFFEKGLTSSEPMNYNANKFRSSDPKRKEVFDMATGLKRMTFAITPDMEVPLNSIKKEFFYDRTQSDMIRELLSAGVRAMRAEKATKEKRCERAS